MSKVEEGKERRSQKRFPSQPYATPRSLKYFSTLRFGWMENP